MLSALSMAETAQGEAAPRGTGLRVWALKRGYSEAEKAAEGAWRHPGNRAGQRRTIHTPHPGKKWPLRAPSRLQVKVH